MGRKKPVNRYRLHAMFAQGKSIAQMCKMFDVKRNTIVRHLREENLVTGSRGVPLERSMVEQAWSQEPPLPLPPPSPAMLALAQFDPVVARCVAQRKTGQA